MNKGKLKTYKKPPVSDQTLNSYIRYFRTLFNACRDKFNDLDVGVINISNYPFKKYKFRKVDRSAGFRSIEIDQLTQLINMDPETLMGRKKIARDMYLLSFYLIGINPTDLFDLTLKDFKNERISYELYSKKV